MHPRVHRHPYVLLALLLLLALTACQETPRPVMTVVPVTPGTSASTPARQVIPQVMTGGETSPVAAPTAAPAGVITPEATPKPRMTVWRPREIAAKIQRALANMLGVQPEEVPWVRYERAVDPGKFSCLDELHGDVPTFGEGEALVYQYKDGLLYVVSSGGKVWVCRTQ